MTRLHAVEVGFGLLQTGHVVVAERFVALEAVQEALLLLNSSSMRRRTRSSPTWSA
jgi:hypothetical protein